MKRALLIWGVPLACLVLILLLVRYHGNYAPWLARRAAPASAADAGSVDDR